MIKLLRLNNYIQLGFQMFVLKLLSLTPTCRLSIVIECLCHNFYVYNVMCIIVEMGNYTLFSEDTDSLSAGIWVLLLPLHGTPPIL